MNTYFGKLLQFLFIYFPRFDRTSNSLLSFPHLFYFLNCKMIFLIMNIIVNNNNLLNQPYKVIIIMIINYSNKLSYLQNHPNLSKFDKLTIHSNLIYYINKYFNSNFASNNYNKMTFNKVN